MNELRSPRRANARLPERRGPGLGWAFAAAAALLFSASLPVSAQTDVTTRTIGELSRQLAKLRGAVEQLSGKLDAQKLDTRNKLRSIAGQRGELALQAQREELRLKQLRQARDKHTKRIAQGAKARAALLPVAKDSITRVRASVQQGLPFKQEERLAALAKLERQLAEGLLTPEKATARLWQFTEDELRLTRESGVYRQTIPVGGQEVLADVARLGMVAMYFQTGDGRVGFVQRDGAGWAYMVVTGEEEQAQIRGLFDSFKKSIRVGFFTLPNGLIRPADGVKPGVGGAP